MSESLDARVAARRQADMVASLRRLRRAPGAEEGNGNGSAPGSSAELCDLCGKELDPDPI